MFKSSTTKTGQQLYVPPYGIFFKPISNPQSNPEGFKEKKPLRVSRKKTLRVSRRKKTPP